MILIKI